MWDKEWNLAVKFGAQAQFKSRLDGDHWFCSVDELLSQLEGCRTSGDESTLLYPCVPLNLAVYLHVPWKKTSFLGGITPIFSTNHDTAIHLSIII
jgi:hypothetical protein